MNALQAAIANLFIWTPNTAAKCIRLMQVTDLSVNMKAAGVFFCCLPLIRDHRGGPFYCVYMTVFTDVGCNYPHTISFLKKRCMAKGYIVTHLFIFQMGVFSKPVLCSTIRLQFAYDPFIGGHVFVCCGCKCL